MRRVCIPPEHGKTKKYDIEAVEALKRPSTLRHSFESQASHALRVRGAGFAHKEARDR